MTARGNRIVVVAEAGVNHNGSLETALELVDVAAEVGADVVKFQTFKARHLASRSAPNAEYQERMMPGGGSQLEMLRRLELDEEAHRKLIARCRDRDIEFLSTPFDLESLKLLHEVCDLPRLKLGSGDLTNAPLLFAAAETGRPIILSTGMASLDEVTEALGVLACGYQRLSPSPAAFSAAFESSAGQAMLRRNVTILHATTEYPAPFDEVNLRALDTLRSTFGLPVGLSDHTVGIAIAVAAAGRGAEVLEKHFTLDRSLPGPDHQASLEPKELRALVKAVRQVEIALGDGHKVPTPTESKNLNVARRSLVAAGPIRRGEKFSPENLGVKRPGGGLAPSRYWELLGCPSPRDYVEDQLIEL